VYGESISLSVEVFSKFIVTPFVSYELLFLHLFSSYYSLWVRMKCRLVFLVAWSHCV